MNVIAKSWALGLVFSVTVLWVGAAPALAAEEAPVKQPSLREPGPDTPDFPDSAYTVSPGVTYVEPALVWDRAKDEPTTRQFTIPTLVRHGLRKDWELRLSGNLLIDEEVAGTGRTGVGDVSLGFKHTLQHEEKGRLGIGASLQLSLPTGSAGFSSDRVEAFGSFNFDHTIKEGLELEWNLGVSLLTSDTGGRFLQPTFLVVIGKELSDKWAIFADGFVSTPSQPGQPDELVAGGGVKYLVNDRLALDASLHAGLTSASPDTLARVGAQFAF